MHKPKILLRGRAGPLARALLAFLLTTSVLGVAGTLATQAPQAGASASTITFAYTGAVQDWTVPAGVSSLEVEIGGGAGGSFSSSGAAGGMGAELQGVLSVTPGEQLAIYVGGAGLVTSAYTPPVPWGYGTPGSSLFGDGGAASAIVDVATGAPLVIAGGGGGGGVTNTSTGGVGGNGGIPNGSAGANDTGGDGGGGGATTSAPGVGGIANTANTDAANGSPGSGSNGGNVNGTTEYGGGGGSGYYGGGAGASSLVAGAGGGGGSSLVPSGFSGEASTTRGGYVTISYGVPPAITSTQASATATEGAAMTAVTFTATGTPTPTFSATGSLPAGVSLSSSGVLSGTPTQSGAFPITVTASNGISPNATQSFTLTVDAPPAITEPASSATTQAGQAMTPVAFTATGYPTPTFAETGSLPSGVTLSSSGVLSGTPTVGGSFPITVVASNGVGTSATTSFTLTVDASSSVTSASSASFVVGTAGSFSVTTAGGYPTPSLQLVGTLPKGLAFTDNGNGTGTLSGTPAAGTGGLYSDVVLASGPGGGGAQPLTVTVDGAPAFTSPANIAIDAGTPFSYQITTTGGYPTPTLTESGTLPSGVAFTNNGDGTGILSGTAPTSAEGSYPISFSAAGDTGGTVTQDVTFAVQIPGATVSCPMGDTCGSNGDADAAPAITSPSSTTFMDGTAASFSVTTTGYPTPAITESGALPSGLSFTDNGNGTASLAGTPTEGGAFPVTITAANQVTPNATQSFTIKVDEAPSFTSATSASFTAGAAGSFSVGTTAYPAPTLSVVGSLPSGLSFTDDGNGTGTISGTPASTDAGTSNVALVAKNGSGSTAQGLTLTIDQPPSITSATSVTTTVGSPLDFQLDTSGFPAPTLTASGTLPSGITLSSTGLLSGTTSSPGSYPVKITATNAAGSTTQSFTLDVDTAPSFTSATSATSTAGTPGSFEVQTTATPTAALTETGPLPSGLTFTDNGNGTATLAGTAPASADGSYPIVVTAKNAAGTASQPLTLNVDATPIIVSATSATVSPGSSLDFQVDASGFPAPTFTASGTLPSGITLSSTGLLSGTTSSPGSYPVKITATNAAGSTSQSFTLLVATPPVVTSASTATFAAGTTSSFEVTTTGSPTPSLSESGALPSGLTFTDNGDGTATLAGAPASGTGGTGGTYAVVVHATSSAGSAGQPLTVTVDQAPQITSPSSTTFTVDADGSFQLVSDGFPDPTYTESGALPAGVTLSASGQLSGTPTSSGTYPVTITATNAGGSTTQSFTLTVSTEASFTGATSSTFTVGTAGSFTIQTAGTPTPTLTESGALPSGITFTPGSGGTATIAGTAAAGTGGTYHVAVTASSTGGSSTSDFTVTVEQAPAVTSATSTTFTEGSDSAFQVTGTGFPAATYTESGSLPTGVSLSASGQLSGTPTSSGTFPVTITATNVAGSATQSFTLTASTQASFTGASASTFVVGKSGSFAIQASGTPTPTLTESGTLPSGLIFTPGTAADGTAGTATIAGTAAAGTGGTYHVAVTASSTGGSSTSDFTLTVHQPPAITSATSTTFTKGSDSAFQVRGTGFPAATYTESGSLPSGVTLSSTGQLSGTPSASGTFPVTITATNVAGSVTRSFTLTVDAAATLTGRASATFVVGRSSSTTFTAGGTPTPSLAKSGTLPSGLAFTAGSGGTATIGGTPAAGTAGSYDVAVTATNAVSSSTFSPVLVVEEAPSITTASTIDLSDGAPSTFQVGATGTPRPTFSEESGTLPPGVSLSAAGLLSGTPTKAGTYPVRVTATNAAGSTTQDLTIEVAALPRISVPSLDATFDAGKAGSSSLSASGYPSVAISEIGTLPPGVRFTDDGDGTATLAGTPAAGAGGTYDLAVVATSSLGQAVEPYEVTVDAAPVFSSSGSVTTSVGSTLSYTVRTADGYPTPKLAEVGTMPKGLVFTNNGDGTATISGTAAVAGAYKLTISASSAVGGPVTQQLTLTVNPEPVIVVQGGGGGGPVPPTAPTPPTPACGAAPAFVAEAGNCAPPTPYQQPTPPAITTSPLAICALGQACSFEARASGYPTARFAEVGTLPPGVSLSSSGLLSGTPRTPGRWVFVLTATNGVGKLATQAFTLDVVSPKVLPEPFDAVTGHLTGALRWSFRVEVPARSLHESVHGRVLDGLEVTTVVPGRRHGRLHVLLRRQIVRRRVRIGRRAVVRRVVAYLGGVVLLDLARRGAFELRRVLRATVVWPVTEVVLAGSLGVVRTVHERRVVDGHSRLVTTKHLVKAPVRLVLVLRPVPAR